jgi:methyl-accepting chemotaxis protein
MPFLAEVTPADNAYLTYIAFAAVITLAVFIRSITGTLVDWRNLKKTDADGKKYATSEELREVHGRVDLIISNTASQIGEMRGEVNKGMEALSQRIMDVLKEESHKSEKSRSEVQRDLQGIQRSLGAMEGFEKMLDQHTSQIAELLSRPKPRS